jgi:ABC-2 type transport system ATP-binding protein
VIEISNVYKTLGENEVLKNINMKVDKGSIFGLIGPNGAGKTTLIKSITGIYKVDKGSIKINGEEIFENPEIKNVIGYVADENSYNSFRVKELAKFYSLAYKTFNKDRFDEINKVFEIPENMYVRNLSKGMRTRLSVMLNLSVMPEVLILDEPTLGLDPIIKKQLIEILLDEVAKRGTTIFISSHDLNDIERICDSIAIINKGEVKYCDYIENIKKNIRKIQVAFKDKVPDDLEKWKEVINVAKVGKIYTIITKEYNDNFINKLRDAGMSFEEELDLSLEDAFIYSVEGDKINEEIC